MRGYCYVYFINLAVMLILALVKLFKLVRHIKFSLGFKLVVI